MLQSVIESTLALFLNYVDDDEMQLTWIVCSAKHGMANVSDGLVYALSNRLSLW